MQALALIIIAGLIAFPLLIAAILFIARNNAVRSVFTILGTIIIALGSIFFAVQFLPTCSSNPISIPLTTDVVEIVSWVGFCIGAILCIYIFGKGIKHHNYIAVLLSLVQLAATFILDVFVTRGIEVENALYIDNLSIIMVLIIGIIGSGICLYALGYMKIHQQHETGKDRRHIFFSIMFIFLAAMFLIVLSNSLAWMLVGWEITTVCSFVLIGYTRTNEAIRNSFRQINLNLIGGIAFTLAVMWSAFYYGTLDFDVFISTTLNFVSADMEVLTYAPLLLLSLAAFTKAAQMPFHSWLLGAMVAPTPTSALLHSSTMVKAGVFLLIKLSPCFGFNLPGFIVMLVGGCTFLMCAIAAISQSNAKRVLAYSTISNLGLIAACAGIGSAGAIWAAIFLLIFHAAAKSLLFLCVGTAEHNIGSRDIESFDALFERMPMLARFMAIGILGMFIAPFGMLISKWAALQAFADSSNIVLILILAFGSAATFAFWAKWLGKILAVTNAPQDNLEIGVQKTEWAGLSTMIILTVGCCLAFPLMSSTIVEPYLTLQFSNTGNLISAGNLWIMSIIALVIAIVFLGFSGFTKKRIVPVYMAGAGIDFEKRTYKGSLGGEEIEATHRNWYMHEMFPEAKVTLIGIVISLVLIVGSFGFALTEISTQKSTLQNTPEASASYAKHDWSSLGITYSTFMQSYVQLSKIYSQNPSTFYSQYNAENPEQYFENAYESYSKYSKQSAQSSSVDETASTSEGGQ